MKLPVTSHPWTPGNRQRHAIVRHDHRGPEPFWLGNRLLSTYLSADYNRIGSFHVHSTVPGLMRAVFVVFGVIPD